MCGAQAKSVRSYAKLSSPSVYETVPIEHRTTEHQSDTSQVSDPLHQHQNDQHTPFSQHPPHVEPYDEDLKRRHSHSDSVQSIRIVNDANVEVDSFVRRQSQHSHRKMLKLRWQPPTRSDVRPEMKEITTATTATAWQHIINRNDKQNQQTITTYASNHMNNNIIITDDIQLSADKTLIEDSNRKKSILANIGCPNCIYNVEEPLISKSSSSSLTSSTAAAMDAPAAPSKDEIRLEAIKFQILSKLGLTAKPNITHELPKQIVLDTLQRADERNANVRQLLNRRRNATMTTTADNEPDYHRLDYSTSNSINDFTYNTNANDNFYMYSNADASVRDGQGDETHSDASSDYDSVPVDDFYGTTTEIISFAEKGELHTIFLYFLYSICCFLVVYSNPMKTVFTSYMITFVQH